MSDIDELGRAVYMPPKSTREVALVEPGRIAALEAENERLREVCRILVAQWETRYRMENAALWEQELYAQARAALEPQP